ncbi:MAG: SMC-Scp complex subunit ScpB, partial [Acidimicrobiia bacterium]
MTEIRRPIEAILFVAESPISARELAEVVEAPLSDVEETLASIERELADRGSGIVLRGVAGGWRFYTAADVLPYLERFAASERATRLS